MKKSPNIDRYEKELISSINTLKEVIKIKDLTKATNIISDITGLMKLYKEAISDSPLPKESEALGQDNPHENSGMYQEDFGEYEQPTDERIFG
tara:strand:- start:2273 stop:2551 length:279 start_codon:yes stop_codon:yes gene_type:complete